MPYSHHGTDLRFADVPEPISTPGTVVNGSSTGTLQLRTSPFLLIFCFIDYFVLSASIMPLILQLCLLCHLSYHCVIYRYPRYGGW